MKRARRKRALPPYVVEDVALATGQVRLYFRAPKTEDNPKPKKIRIYPSVEEAGFWPAYDAALRGEQMPKPAKPEKVKRGTPESQTFKGLCAAFFRSAKFSGLAEGTRIQWKRSLEACCKEPLTDLDDGLFVGGTPITVFGPRHVKWLMDRKAGMPEAANNRLKTVRAVFAWHLEGTSSRNPCKGIKKLDPNNADGFHTWTVDEAAQYEARHPIGTNARLAFDLARFTTQRKSDVARLGPQHVVMRDGLPWLKLQQTKSRRVKSTKGIVEIPIIGPLVASIALRPRIIPAGEAEAFLMTSRGKPYTVNGLGNAFRDWCNEAKLPHCSMHGLRKATLSMFAELGVNEEGISSVSGHAPGSRALAAYTKAARKHVLAGNAFAALQEELTKRAEERSDPAEISPEMSHFILGLQKNGTITEGEI